MNNQEKNTILYLLIIVLLLHLYRGRQIKREGLVMSQVKKEIDKVVSKATRGLERALRSTIDTVKRTLENTIKNLRNFVEEIKKTFERIIAQIQETIKIIIETIKKLPKKLVDGTLNIVPNKKIRNHLKKSVRGNIFQIFLNLAYTIFILFVVIAIMPYVIMIMVQVFIVGTMSFVTTNIYKFFNFMITKPKMDLGPIAMFNTERLDGLQNELEQMKQKMQM